MFLSRRLGASLGQLQNALLQLNAACQCSFRTWSQPHHLLLEDPSSIPSTSGRPIGASLCPNELGWPYNISRGFAAASQRSSAFRDNAYQKFQQMAQEYKRIQQQITEAGLSGDGERIQRLSKSAGQLEPLANGYEQLLRLVQEFADACELEQQEQDAALKQLAREEQRHLEEQINELFVSLLLHLVPVEECEERNVVMEMRAGAGGQWAADFNRDLLEMYGRYSARQGWRFEVIETSETDTGGYKSASILITGPGAYGALRHESGVHRVTDVPGTEKNGRMQTATASVAVLPEATEVEVHLAESDIRVDTFCASGPGGQHVNKTESAVRVTHLPTGMAVACQSERSQHQNKAKALQVLRSKIHEAEQAKQEAAAAAARQAASGRGGFNERIRSYYYQDGRVCDHRCGLTIQDVDKVLSGERLGEIIAAVQSHIQQQQLEELLSEEVEMAAAG